MGQQVSEGVEGKLVGRVGGSVVRVDEGEVVLEDMEPGKLLLLGGVALAVLPDPGLEEVGVGEGQGREAEKEEGDECRRELKGPGEVHERRKRPVDRGNCWLLSGNGGGPRPLVSAHASKNRWSSSKVSILPFPSYASHYLHGYWLENKVFLWGPVISPILDKVTAIDHDHLNRSTLTSLSKPNIDMNSSILIFYASNTSC